MKQIAIKKVPLSKDALNLLESKRSSPEESYSDIILRAIKSENTAKPTKNKIRISDAGLQSMIRQEVEDAKKMGENYGGGYEW